MNRSLLFIFLLLNIGCSEAAVQGTETPDMDAEKVQVHLQVNTTDQHWVISPYITGSHFVYAEENDELYKDGRITAWMKASGVKVIRWPGGTVVNNYHWNDLNGIPFKEDTWDPAYDQPYESPSEYMDLDEYIRFCRKVGAEPMVGINIGSGIRYGREEDSLEEARGLVQYCKDKNYNVRFWYIGNEGYTNGYGNPEVYASYIDEYGALVRSIIPDAKIIGDWKFGPEEKRRFDQTLRIAKASEEIDIMEMHEKWGNGWGLASGNSFEEWASELPLYNGKYADYIRRFNEEMKAAGRDVRLGMNEWGLGDTEADEFQNGLIAADYMIQMYCGDIYSACYWNLNMGSQQTRILKKAEGGHTLEKISPIGHIFELFGDAGGKDFHPLTSDDRGVYGFAATSADKDKVILYILNKRASGQTCSLDLEGIRTNGCKMTLQTYSAPGEELEETTVKAKGNTIRLDLKAYSFNKLSLDLE